MSPLLRCPLVSVLVLSALMSAVTLETVVGVAGRRVRLPCRTEAAGQGEVEVCWGRGQPSVLSCQNAVIHASGNRVMYKKSYRYSVSSSSSSLSIFSSRAADSGFYHCRVHLPGLFNDQTAIVHLIVVDGSTGDVAGDNSTGPAVARVQSSSIQHQGGSSLLGFVGNTVRASFIIFIPVLLLTAAYRYCRTSKAKTDGLTQPEEEESSV